MMCVGSRNARETSARATTEALTTRSGSLSLEAADLSPMKQCHTKGPENTRELCVLPPLLGERAGVRASVSSNLVFEVGSYCFADWLSKNFCKPSS